MGEDRRSTEEERKKESDDERWPGERKKTITVQSHYSPMLLHLWNAKNSMEDGADGRG